jgi:hypothetical protein
MAILSAVSVSRFAYPPRLGIKPDGVGHRYERPTTRGDGEGEERAMPAREAMPSTVRRSSNKAQETWAKTYDSALQEYGEGDRPRRTAFASLKHSFEKVGDHWEPKSHKGPSDPQAARSGGDTVRRRPAPTAGGVDTNASKQHLYELAKKLDVPGRSTMSKPDLVDALRKANNRQTAHAHSD